jgi:hypothetical protein
LVRSATVGWVLSWSFRKRVLPVWFEDRAISKALQHRTHKGRWTATHRDKCVESLLFIDIHVDSTSRTSAFADLLGIENQEIVFKNKSDCHFGKDSVRATMCVYLDS